MDKSVRLKTHGEHYNPMLRIFQLTQFDKSYKTTTYDLVEFTMKFGFYTLGCKVNQYETQAMEQLLTQWGHTVGAFSEACDGYIVNTCSVTAMADRKNRTLIRRLRKEHPEAIIGVCGCYSQQDPKAVEQLDVDVVGGSADREEFLRRMLEAIRGRCSTRVDKALARRQFEILPPGGLEARTRAMLKVQDGCCNFCTYCIIPYTRGPVRSAPVELAVEQAESLARKGYRELVVTGIEIASWGVDLPGKPSLGSLLTAICRAVPDLRVRLGSLEPRCITEDFCRELAALPNLCKHFHLSMQSGCDTVLARMKRKYTTARYLESVELLRKFFPHCAITTDMIVGFPGESEEEFAQSLDFIRRCAFAAMHIFPYSRRPGTPADKMPDQLPNSVKEERSHRAIALAADMEQAFLEGCIGQTMPVLFEEKSGDFYTGHTENYVKVYATGEDLHNQILPVRMDALFSDGLLGTCVPIL